MMMTLGFFVFSRLTVPYQTSQHDMVWRHPTNSRVGARPSAQFLGVGDETLTLSGVLMPEITGGELSLEALRKMADTGKAYPLIEGRGTVTGFFVIEKISKGRSEFFSDGAARKIEFTIELKRVDEKNTSLIANENLIGMGISKLVRGIL
ncbi:MAG: phage tail protein [Gammaproteobacteria bacterium]|uniref:Phage protein U n=2 Tax=Shewanella TaxID=22 RepID=A0A380B7V8_9GAMM|nr:MULTISPECIES: phage tail protein [Shewanella]MBU1391193.1 phage tail protein [Gammaproteobacteria bacterium]ABX50056.1 P2 GpU family protein [Shewanella baltica OS195]ADT95049.1 P2 GpU family protein [Shewanella baltica OS678]MBU1479313.1 phage tail protein [Gammaproteobacteria bacterium]MBU2002314.1 phage tail protein [Gammaproteobacteria bacterium]